MKINTNDVQSLTDLGGAGNESKLINDTQIYVTANSINTTLYAAIVAAQVGGGGSSAIIVLPTGNTYDMTSTQTDSRIVHTQANSCVYKLPAANGSTIKTFTFQHQGVVPTGSTVVTVGASNNLFYFYRGSTTYTATLTQTTYTYAALATELQTRMNAQDSNSYVVTFDLTNRYFKITGSAAFQLKMATNTTNSCSIIMGFEVADTASATTQLGMRLDNVVIIRPNTSNAIQYRGNLVENPGYIMLDRKGISVKITNIDSTTWVVDRMVNQNHEKNSTMGSDKDVAIVGRDVWVTKATGGTARSHIAGFTLNGFGYICDGTTGSNSNEVNQYNDSANTWATKATGGSARAYLSGFTLNGYGYICDGYIAGNSNEVNQYNDAANTWATMATAGTARNGVAGFAFNGYGYNFGGLVVSTKYNEVNQYNDSANTWATMATCGTARCYLAGFSLNGYGYACDGYDNVSTYYNEVNQYNDSANTWTTKALGGTSRQSPTSFSLNGYGYICDGNTTAVSNEVNQYSDSYNTWTTKALAGTARNGVGSFALNGYGYVCDGITGSVTNEVNQYN